MGYAILVCGGRRGNREYLLAMRSPQHSQEPITDVESQIADAVLAQPGQAITTASLFTHGRPERIGDAAERVAGLARRLGVELVDAERAEMIVVLGGDGTMLRALQAALPFRAVCLGVNFGRVGFLTSIDADHLEQGLERAFAGDWSWRSSTIVGDTGHGAVTGINDIVLTSGLRPNRWRAHSTRLLPKSIRRGNFPRKGGVTSHLPGAVSGGLLSCFVLHFPRPSSCPTRN